MGALGYSLFVDKSMGITSIWWLMYPMKSHLYQHFIHLWAIFLVASTPLVFSNRGSEVPGTSQNPKPEHSSSDCRRGKVGERWGNSVTLERWDVNQRGFSQFSQDSGFFWWNKVSYSFLLVAWIFQVSVNPKSWSWGANTAEGTSTAAIQVIKLFVPTSFFGA
jgi:hypothetical protein